MAAISFLIPTVGLLWWPQVCSHDRGRAAKRGDAAADQCCCPSRVDWRFCANKK